jgi:alkylation response protein AidB-like acyl-CoA dehydrogenase
MSLRRNTTDTDVATFAFTPEQEALRATVRKFLATRSPETTVRSLMETESGYDPGAWIDMASQLDLQALLIPEQFGGAGASFVDMQIVCEEMGSALLCAPFLGSAVLATTALLYSEDEEAQEHSLPALADGSVIGALAVAEDSGSWSPAEVTMRAEPTADPRGRNYRLTGVKSFVLDGMHANLLLVVARTEHGFSLFRVEDDAPGLERISLATLDATRKQARLVLANTPGTLVGAEGAAAHSVSAAMDLGVGALAAEQTGGARRTLDMAVAYANLRQQFGHPIGYFQAIKHKCADMLLEVECSVSAAYAVGWAVDEGSTEVGMLASLAKAYCSEAYYHCAAENIQIHGGVGFTWEHSAHLYFKRATSGCLLFGPPRQHREQLLHRLGLEETEK